MPEFSIWIWIAVLVVLAIPVFFLEWRKIRECEQKIAGLNGKVKELELELSHFKHSRSKTEAVSPAGIEPPGSPEADHDRVGQGRKRAEALSREGTESFENAERERSIALKQQKESEERLWQSEANLKKAESEREAAQREAENAVREREAVLQFKDEARALHAKAERNLEEAKALVDRARFRFLPDALHDGALVALVDELLKTEGTSPLKELALARIHQVTGLLQLSSEPGSDVKPLHAALRDLGGTLAEWLNTRHDASTAANALGEVADSYNMIAQGRYQLRGVKIGETYNVEWMEATPRPELISRVKGWAVFTGKSVRVSRAPVN